MPGAFGDGNCAGPTKRGSGSQHSFSDEPNFEIEGGISFGMPHTSMKGHGSLPPPLASSKSDETGRAGERWGGGHHRPLFEPKEYLSRQQKSREAMQA